MSDYNGDIYYFLFIIFIIFVIIILYLFYNKKQNYYYDYNYNNNNYSIGNKIIDNKNNDNINNPGYINELIKLPFLKNENEKEYEYVKQFNKIKEVVPSDNNIGFCPISKKDKQDLPYSDININCL